MTVLPPAGRSARADASTARRRSPGPRPTPTSTRPRTRLSHVRSRRHRARPGHCVVNRAAEAIPGVVAVLTPDAPSAGRPGDQELAVLQAGNVAFRGQYVAAVVAETPEIARQAAGLVVVSYAEQAHTSCWTGNPICTRRRNQSSRPTPNQRGRRRGRAGLGGGDARRDLYDAGRAPQPDGAAHDGGAVGRRVSAHPV